MMKKPNPRGLSRDPQAKKGDYHQFPLLQSILKSALSSKGNWLAVPFFHVLGLPPRAATPAPQLSPRSKNSRNPYIFCRILQFVLTESRSWTMQHTEITRLMFLDGLQRHFSEKCRFKLRNSLKQAVQDQISQEKAAKLQFPGPVSHGGKNRGSSGRSSGVRGISRWASAHAPRRTNPRPVKKPNKREYEFFKTRSNLLTPPPKREISKIRSNLLTAPQETTEPQASACGQDPQSSPIHQPKPTPSPA